MRIVTVYKLKQAQIPANHWLINCFHQYPKLTDLSHCCAIINTSKLRTRNKNDSQSLYMDKSHSVQRHFFKFSCVCCTPPEGIQKLVAQGYKCSENKDDYVKK